MRGWCLRGRELAQSIALFLRDCRPHKGANLPLAFNLVTLTELYGMAAQPNERVERLAQPVESLEMTQARWAEAGYGLPGN